MGYAGQVLSKLGGVMALAAIAFAPAPAFAQWTDNVAVNTPVATGVNPQSVRVAEDGSGGYYVAYLNDIDAEPFAEHWQLLVQHLDADGNRLWGDSGIALTEPAERVLDPSPFYEWPQIVSDGQGNAIVSWWLDQETEPPQASLIAEKLDPNGNSIWTGGRAVVVQSGYPSDDPSPMVPDGAGGAIIAWTDYGHFAESTAVLAQRISDRGENLWPSVTPGQPDGMLVGEGGGVDMIPGPGNGAMLTFSHYINGVYAQRLSGAGDALWGAGGKVIGNSDFESVITEDSDGGAIVGWVSYKAETGAIGSSPTVQKLSLDGTEIWPAGGVGIPPVVGYMSLYSYEIVTDGMGGVYFLHNTDQFVERHGINRLLADGTLAWTAPVEFYAQSYNIDIHPKMVPDGENGVIVTYTVRGPGHTPNNWIRDIQAQRFGPDGSLMWGRDGIPVTTAEGDLFEHRLICADGHEPVSVWVELRPDAPGVYAQRLPMVDSPPADGLAELWSIVMPDKNGGVQVETSCKETRKGMKCKLKAKLVIANSGTADARKFTSTAYLSQDAELSPDDLRIKDLKVKKVKAEMGKTVKVKVSGTLPEGFVGPGSYLIIQVDSDNSIGESIEDNNLTVVGPLPVN